MTHVVQAQLQVQHSVMTSPTAVLVLELYQWQASGVAAAQSDLRTSAVSRLNRARSRGMASAFNPNQAFSQVPAPLARASVSSSSSGSRSSSGSSNSSYGGGKAESRGLSPELAVESKSDAELNSSHRGFGGGNKADSGAALVLFGVARLPLRHIPESRSGVMAELDGEVVGNGGGGGGEGGGGVGGGGGGGVGGVQEGWPCVVEVQAWHAARYSAEQLKGQTPDQSMTNDSRISLELVTSPGYASHMVSVLTEDLLSKQTALEKLQSAALRAEGSSQLGLWRMHEAEKKNAVLAADLAQLRKLLHEEKSSSKVSSGANASSSCLPLLSFFLCCCYFPMSHPFAHLLLYPSVHLSSAFQQCYILYAKPGPSAFFLSFVVMRVKEGGGREGTQAEGFSRSPGMAMAVTCFCCFCQY